MSLSRQQGPHCTSELATKGRWGFSSLALLPLSLNDTVGTSLPGSLTLSSLDSSGILVERNKPFTFTNFRLLRGPVLAEKGTKVIFNFTCSQSSGYKGLSSLLKVKILSKLMIQG